MMLRFEPADSPFAKISDTMVDNGYSVIPCMPGSKWPGRYQRKTWSARYGWQTFGDRLPTDIELRHWNSWPGAGVCLVLNKTIKVLDVDTDDPDIRAALLKVIPDSPVKKRGAKGFSAFYRGSETITSRSFNLGGERVLDLLAYGKQTVIPPTLHPDTGKPYFWTEGSETLIDVPPEDLPELPEDIVDRIEDALSEFGYLPPIERDVVYGDADTAWREINDLALANLDAWVPDLGLPRLHRSMGGYRAVAGYRPSGSGKPTEKRNRHLSIHASGIKDWGDNDRSYTPIDLVMVTRLCAFQDAFDWLRDKLGIEPPKVNVEALKANAERRRNKGDIAPEKPLSIPAEAVNDESVVVEKTSKAVRAPMGEMNPHDTKMQGGIMGAVSRWMLESAWRPVPEFATIGAIAFCAALFGRRYASPTGLGLNLYLMGIAGPGFGKDHPLKALQNLMADAGMQYLVGPGDITSDSALEHVIRQRACFVMPMDEIGVFMQATGGRNAGGYERRIRKVLLDIYTKGDGMWTGKQKVPTQGSGAVNDSAAEPVFNPTVSIMGMSTPTEFYSGLSEANLSDGMVARMTIINASKRPTPRDDREPVIPPRSLVAEVKRVASEYPTSGGNLQNNNWRMPTARPAIYHVPWETPQVKGRWREIEDWQLSVIDDDPSKDGLVSRAAEQTLKLATLRAVSRSPADPKVSMDDVEWGWSIVSQSIWSLESGVDKHMVNGDFEKLCKAILEAVERHGGKMPKSQLLRARGVGKEPRMVSAALQHLAEAQRIYPVPTGGRATVTLMREAA
ncbi:bifunctional DNA primase/polymerase [Nitratireductor kimnyeongensis]|uniref:Bifunctional DNA primase/polymerase n=1 Tax=Nitratireductor kimnyeongensis TaxID=430679 RepID=A0ABW0T5K9_9HYPH|nr:bifunctional DNA primase/polymerase [Nitratireductor kimnyeongensis]QZZ34560.1 bifunctional DNA primase/polymerase [Nitratireductor kimnyeongensis]